MIEYFRNVSDILRTASPDRIQDLANSFSDTQYQSKKWLMSMLAKQNVPKAPSVLILGGWYGSYLVPWLNEAYAPRHILLTDVDPETLVYAEMLHGIRNIKQRTLATGLIDVETELFKIEQRTFDVVINTSCEHIHGFGDVKTANPDTLYVYQSCDRDNDPGHINPVSSTNELIEKSKLTKILFRGRLDLGHKNRYMVIGQKQ